MTGSSTQMRHEITQIPDVVAHLVDNGQRQITTAADALTLKDPAFLTSIARGSSDHVATYLKYASELMVGIPMASVGPSIASIYKRPLNLSNSVALTVSQSGKSPDIVEMAQMATRQGATTIALTNDAHSPLAETCEHIIDIQAGHELSVAATKTFLNSAVAGLWVLAEWANDKDLIKAIHQLPEYLAKAVKADWSEACAALKNQNSVFCLGRGPAFAISNEAALKFKETCQIHAESYSSAEVLHGPVSIVDTNFPIIAFVSNDAAESSVISVADQLAEKGANVFVTSTKSQTARQLEAIRTDHPLTDPIALIASFYAMVEQLAVARGINPDAPRHLKKVTETR